MNELTLEEIKKQWELAAQKDEYRDYIAAGHDNEKTFTQSGKDDVERLEQLLNEHELSIKDKKILEIGCGAGRMTQFLMELASFIYATDISQGMLDRFKERLGQPKNVKLMLNTDKFDGVPDAEVDMVVTNIVFQHMPEKEVEKLVADSARILKNSGHLVFFIPLAKQHESNLHPIHPTKSEKKGNAFIIIGILMNRWRRDEVVDLAEKYGFVVEYAPIQTENCPREYFIFKKRSSISTDFLEKLKKKNGIS